MTMSKVARKRRTCERKVRHANEREAVIARQRMSSRASGSVSAMTYHCEICGGWHLGNLVGKLADANIKKPTHTEESKG